jgi:hypothetical protein
MQNYSVDISFNKTDYNGGYKIFQENVTLSIYNLFNKDNVFYFICFLLAFFILFYFLIGYKSGSGNEGLSAFSNTLDIICLVIIIIICIVYYFVSSREDKDQLFGKLLRSTENFLNDPKSIIYVILIIIVFYATIFICRIPMTKETKPITVLIIEHNLLLSLIPIIVIDLFRYLFGIDLVTMLFEWIYKIWFELPNHAGDVISQTQVATPVINPQKDREVFNISNNLYTYDDAQAICKSYDSRLATYDEVESSYNDGGEWCNYGWSEDQMILFPTQKASWDKLQKTKDNKNDCGRPGVNGGFISNTTAQFGVNCFGIKPPAKSTDMAKLADKNNPIIPKTKEDEILDAKVKYWQANKDKLLTINSFNKDKWKEY